MTGRELQKKIKQLGRQNGVTVSFTKHGKGSHGRLYFGERFTTMKDQKKEIGPGLLRKMCRDLGIDPNEL